MTGTSENRQIRLAARPVGLPKDSDWELTSESVPEPGDGFGHFRTAAFVKNLDGFAQ